MRRVLFLLPLLALGLLVPVALSPAPATGAQQESAATVSVTLDRSSAVAGPGERVRFTSTVRNEGGRALTGLIAHLNILSSDADVYVDPEDWSPRRTQYLDELGAGAEQVLEWDVRAVTSGPLVLYVAVSGPDTPIVTASGPLRMQVQGRRVVNSQNVLPLVAGVPAGVLALVGVAAIRRRRQT